MKRGLGFRVLGFGFRVWGMRGTYWGPYDKGILRFEGLFLGPLFSQAPQTVGSEFTTIVAPAETVSGFRV